MKKRKKKKWIKRATATGMAVCMTLTSSTQLLAEGVTAETEIQEITDEEFASGDSASDSTETSNQTENIESGEPGDQNASADFTDTEIQPEDTDPAETGSQLNGTESEEGEDQPDTIGSEDKADSAAEDSQEIHLSLELIAEDVGADAQEAKLTLAAADKLSTNLNVKNNTVEVTGGEGLILLSNVKPEDYKGSTIKLITTSGWDLTSPVTPKGTSYSFQGLGSETCPYAGTLELDASTAAKQYSITTTKPLFQALSTKATLSGTIPFSISETAPSTKKPLLADVLIAADGGKTILKANIVLRDLNSDKINDAAIGGLIGTMKAGTSADITFENQFTKDLKVSGESHTGLFCSTMEQNTSLTAEFSNTSAGKINVEAGAADAGGFVGHIETDASLTAAGNSVTQVSSVSGNAGGLAGSATDGSISIKEGDTLTFADTLTLKSASDKAAGGLIGEYTVTKGNEIGYNLSGYKFNNIAVSGGGDAGGLFGVIRNTSTAGTTVSVSGTTAAPVKTAVTGAVTNLGGLIGSYQSGSMDNTLSVKGDSNSFIQSVTMGGNNVNASYGGVVGVVSGSSYAEIENVSALTADMKKDSKASFGGLVGKIEDGLLNIGNVTLTTAGSNDLAEDGVDGRGGLVGHLVKGIVRLHGTTDLSRQKITTAYNHTGQIVGNNENGLVYALGNGNTSSDSQTGWKLIRYSGTDRSGSDIGNWGSVVRLDGTLTEGTEGVFSFDKTAHTVKVNNGTGADISNANAFAAYALAFDLSKAYTGSAALSFNSTVNPAATQTVTLSGNIDLTGTGILGIGKDSVEKGASAQKFQGTLNGNNHTIRLDIGTAYGVSGADNAAGQLYARRKNSKDAHYSLALIPFSSDATIQDVTIAGKINCKVPKTVDQETKEDSPAFVSAVVGLASGTTSFNNVTVNAAASVSRESEGAKELQVWQGGFLGQCEGNTLEFRNCTWGNEASLTDERGTDHQRIGGLAADVLGGCTVSVKDCTLSGIAASNAGANARVGGLIAVSRGENKNGTAQLSTINISDLMVNGERINVAAANKTSGGLLGYQWKNTNVVFAEGTNSNGVNISGSTLNADSQFGGLVYQATGYWKATAANSIVFQNKNTFTGKSSQNSPSGLLVGTGLVTKEYTENNVKKTGVESALYLEVGTWGSTSGVAYKIGSGAVTLHIAGAEYFDELVGITKYNDAGNNNAVVSLAVRDANGAAVQIDRNNNRTTYTGQLGTNYKNSKTRYYYNLDSYRKNNPELNLNSVNTPENLILWSAAQYAAPNIRGCFRKDDRTDVTISGAIDLTGYSYYPVTPIGAVNLGGSTNTSVTFDYDGMNTTEESNKKLSDSEHQHYLMQHGLFYNVSRNIKVNNTTFAGTVGKEESGTANTYNSGALIYGSVTGDPVYIVDISLNNVTLAGIRVTGVQKDTYAPLLINKLDQAVRLTVNNLSTGTGYTDGNATTYAATSLVGKVGSATATKLTLFFSNIALDGRLNADTANSTSVLNNGNTKVEYHTTHTIFTKATLLDSFMYSSEGSGTYNFNTTDNKVTYGVELTNAGTTGRNPDKQYQYYDDDTYISDQTGQTADEAYVKSRYAADNFIRYVYTQQKTTASQYELDINQKTTGLLKGCGTYGDPYIIEDAQQLSSLAAYIQKPDNVSKFQAVFNQKVLEKKSQTAEGYHTQKLNDKGDNATEGDILCTWENKTWTDTTQGKVDTETATQYLLNAYYKISKDIMISAGSFSGLGTLQQPFSGVIVGASNIKVSVTGTNENKDSFGGLIAYSRGSVVKDLTVDYSQATIAMRANDSLPGINKKPFFGGVVGYCMGGDTIIDNVSVNYAANSISFSGTYSKLIAAGGYVGLVGGATHVTEDSDYEKTGGGVVFRNMNNTTNSFTTACADAGTVNKTVNMVNADDTADGKTTIEGGTCFYRNPYVGRVLDGYACAEECTVNNTDKNYTIPTLQAGTKDLQVTEKNGSLNVKVTSAQGLWLLSAIVNSGAGAMDAAGNYTDVDGQVVDAYQYGKPRTGTYDGIGTDITNAASVLSDEAYWGGTAGTAKDRVSYLVKKYTTGTAAARLAGKSSAVTNIPVNLTFDTNSIDMSSYGNGFRGIGSSYGENKLVKTDDCSIPKVYRRNLLVNSINAGSTTDTVIKLDINQNDYTTEYDKGSWRNQGAGLFVDFHFTDKCTVNHLGISGNVKVGLFDTNGNLTYVTERNELIGVGGFAARTANSKGTVSFENFRLDNIQVYGGVMTGGAIGYIDGYKNAGRNVTFKNWTIDNEKVSTYVYMNGSTGGLVGWNNGYGQLTITGSGDGSDEVNANNLEVSTIAAIFEKDTKTSGSGAVGGLAGLCEYGTVTIENVNTTKLTVTGKNVRDVGGLIAAGRIKGDQININNCLLDSISVTVSNDQIKKDNNIGGVIGFTEKPLKISKVTIKNNSYVSGQKFAGGFVGSAYKSVTIQNCEENSTNIQATLNWVGGFIGYVAPNMTAVFNNCREKNINILGRYVGGLVGAVDGNITASNMELVKVMAVTNKADTKCAGLVTGNTANNDSTTSLNNNVKGYNILADSCKTGYNGSAKVEALSNSDINTMSDCGFWIGKNGAKKKTTINLTAVAAKGEVFPQKDIGTQNGSATIIYADASVDQKYNPTKTTGKPSSSAAPWLDVNPKSDVPFADGTVMTGNGAGTGTASNILSELKKDSPSSAYYWNLKDKKKELAKFLDSTNDAYVTTYRSEEKTTTTVDEKFDFPVLVVNNTADVDEMLWNYIAAMTNVKNGTEARTQSKDITATTYKWNQGKFAVQKNASLSVNSSSKKISIVPNAYDNQNSQFTLLDVTYANPTNDNAEPFHLYIPILVKKVLYISFKARFLAGTDYCAEDYPMNDSSTNHYATAGFGEPLTAYMEYSYEKETDWQSMLDNGENLLWYYDKILDLVAESTGETGKTLLPSGTRLTLLDRQTKQYYTYTTTGKENLRSFDLSQMTAPDDKTGFTPVSICDLLELTAEPVTEVTDGKTYYVEDTEADHAKATVRIGTTYYRKADEKELTDGSVIKYSIALSKTSKAEARTESYYLTIQIPETEGYSVINNRLNYGTFSRKEGTLPAVIKSDAAVSSSAYVVYNGVEQTFEISSSREHNGSVMGDTTMENGDSIIIKLESKLKLTEAGKDKFDKLGPAEFYHEFDVSMKKYLQKEAAKYDVIGTEMVDYTYTLSGNGLNQVQKGSIQDAAGLETLTLKYGGKELKMALEQAKDDDTAVTVTAEIRLTYAGADHFPVRNASDSEDNRGISPEGVSRIANAEVQLPITENKKTTEDNNRYYITNPSRATLTYYTVDGAGVGDTTQQLGINPSDETNPSDIIYTRADYNYSNVDENVLKKASQIRYKLELFQKNANGIYDETAPLAIGDYLQNLTKDSKEQLNSKSSGQAYQWEETFEADDTRSQTAGFHFTPLIGEAFEKAGYTYANYRVRLTAVLLNESGAELEGTKATDYIIYTNARICQEILERY